MAACLEEAREETEKLSMEGQRSERHIGALSTQLEELKQVRFVV